MKQWMICKQTSHSSVFTQNTKLNQLFEMSQTVRPFHSVCACACKPIQTPNAWIHESTQALTVDCHQVLGQHSIHAYSNRPITELIDPSGANQWNMLHETVPVGLRAMCWLAPGTGCLLGGCNEWCHLSYATLHAHSSWLATIQAVCASSLCLLGKVLVSIIQLR